MPRFAANLTMMYNEHAFLGPFPAAAKKTASKRWSFCSPTISAQVNQGPARSERPDSGLFNAPPGDWAAANGGIAFTTGREDEFRRSIETALDYTRVLG